MEQQTAPSQRVERVGVERETTALANRFAVRLEAEGGQRLEYRVFGTRAIARGIEIVDSQPPPAATASGIQVAAGRRNQRAEVEGAGGRGCETAGRGRLSGNGRRGRRTASRAARGALEPRC